MRCVIILNWYKFLYFAAAEAAPIISTCDDVKVFWRMRPAHCTMQNSKRNSPVRLTRPRCSSSSLTNFSQPGVCQARLLQVIWANRPGRPRQTEADACLPFFFSFHAANDSKSDTKAQTKITRQATV